MNASAGLGAFAGTVAKRVLDTHETASGSMWRAPDAPEAAKLTFGFPDPAVLPVEGLRSAIEGVLEDDGGKALQYGGGTHKASLTDQIKSFESHQGVTHDDRTLTVVNGATAGVDLVAQMTLDPGDTVITGAPTYMGALNAFHNYDVTIEGIPVDEHGLDVEVLETRLEERKAAGEQLPTLVYVVPNFQNPTGWSLSTDRRRRLLELAARYDMLILEDDAYGALGFDSTARPSLATLDTENRVLRLGTFSKTIAPGIRTGWISGPAPLIDTIDRLDIGGSHSFIRGVLGYYLANTDIEAALTRLQREYQNRRDHLLAVLDSTMPEGVSWSKPDGGFFVWVQAPTTVDTEAMLDQAAENGVVYLPGGRFVPDGSAENCLRLSFSYADLETITTGVTALAETIAERT